MSDAASLPEADFGSTPETATPEQIGRVNNLALQALELEAQIEDLSSKLTNLNDRRSAILDRDLVAAMTEARLEVWPVAGGRVFELATMIGAGITEANKRAAHEFLESHGHGDIIKRRFTISFGRDELAWAKKFERDIAKRKKPLDVERKDWVEPQTLKAFVKEQLRLAMDEGRDPEDLVPSSLFGVFRRTFAALVVPKAAKPRAMKTRK